MGIIITFIITKVHNPIQFPHGIFNRIKDKWQPIRGIPSGNNYLAPLFFPQFFIFNFLGFLLKNFLPLRHTLDHYYNNVFSKYDEKKCKTY